MGDSSREARCEAWEDEQRRLDESWVSTPCPCVDDAKAPGQPTACYVAESSPAPYTNAGVDVALANVIGATFFAVLVLFGFYAVYRGFQSRERAKRRIASDIIRVLKEDEERAVKYKVLQLTQPGGEVAAALRMGSDSNFGVARVPPCTVTPSTVSSSSSCS